MMWWVHVRDFFCGIGEGIDRQEQLTGPRLELPICTLWGGFFLVVFYLTCRGLKPPLRSSLPS